MAIGIAKDGVCDVWSMPVVGAKYKDGLFGPDWEDKTWFIDHLRHLAHKLETEDVMLAEVGLGVDRSAGCPVLYTKVIPRG